ncbi:MAG: gfo/Idh/MocA family oxidoreductase, partial [Rhizobium oryzihabitans]
KTIDVEPVATNYEKFAKAVMDGGPADPDFRHAANLQKVLDLSIIADRERRELAVSA